MDAATAGCNTQMSANFQFETLPAPSGEIAEALYIESGKEHLFAWMHRPAAGHATDLGLVVCNPFGYEAICSHRSVRAFAEGAAAVGVSALRFDYRGTGDSADIDASADQIDAWARDVVAAVTELRRRTGVQRVCVLGFRLGALLATLAARDCGICGLLVVAPIVSGRRYLRELRTTRLAAMIGAEPASTPRASGEDRAGAPSLPLEVSGYLLSSATLATLGKVDLATLTDTPAPRVFMIDSESLPAARGWSEALTHAGVEVTYQTAPGMVEMLMTAPQFAEVPRHMIAAMQEWLASVSAARPDARMPSSHAASPPGRPQTCMTLTAGGRQSATLTEKALRFGPDAALFGIVTEPPKEDRRRRAVILLNPGVDHHIGASRLYVPLARKWSARGYVVLRMDLAGIGDSATRPGNQDDEVFPASALDDIRSAIHHLRNHYNVGDISLVGLCSGAYHALRAAAAGIQVHRILMINPQNYFWKEGMSLNDLQLVEVVRNPGVYRQQVFSAAAWRRLISGEVNLYRIVMVFVQRLQLSIVHSLRNLAKRLRIRLTDDLGRELEEISARGVGIAFIFARGEPGLDLLKLEGGASVNRLGSRCRVHILDSGDHVFSHHDSRAALESVLDDELFKKAHLTDAQSSADAVPQDNAEPRSST